MGTRIAIEFSSETVYCDSDVKHLKNMFADFMNEFDDDADPSTIKVSMCNDEGDSAKTEYTFDEFVEMLRTGVIEMTAKVMVENQKPIIFSVNNDYDL